MVLHVILFVFSRSRPGAAPRTSQISRLGHYQQQPPKPSLDPEVCCVYSRKVCQYEPIIYVYMIYVYIEFCNNRYRREHVHVDMLYMYTYMHVYVEGLK